jgi:hypothetical protein
LQARWDDIFINYNMYRRNINIKTNCGQQTGKALSNHERFSPSQSHEKVPLSNPINTLTDSPFLRKRLIHIGTRHPSTWDM